MDASSAVIGLNVLQMKAILRYLCLPVSGRKPVLKNRVLEYLKANGKEALNQLRELGLIGKIAPSNSSIDLTCQFCSCALAKPVQSHSSNELRLACMNCQLLRQIQTYEVEKILIMPFSITNRALSFSDLVISYSMMNKVISARGALQIQLRCMKSEGVGYIASWPRSGWITLNNKIIMEFTKQGLRDDDPLNITTLLESGIHTLCIYSDTVKCKFFAGVYLVRRLRDSQIRAQVLQRAMDLTACKNACFEMLKPKDNRVKTEGFTLSLACPISKTLIKVPVRGLLCRHLACFDLDSWLKFQRITSASRLKCPICLYPVVSLQRDLFIERILEDASQLREPVSALVSGDLSYEIFEYSQVSTMITRSRRELESVQPSKRHKTGNRDCPIEID